LRERKKRGPLPKAQKKKKTKNGGRKKKRMRTLNLGLRLFNYAD
jgi:hypothetical protein